MRKLLTTDLKVRLLGITPLLKDRGGVLNSQEIVALSSQATFKGKSIKNLLKDIKKGGESLKERIKKTLQGSSLRGHASLSTTPAICLTFEGSKFLDSALTGIIFSSSLMASGRRTQTTKEDIILPKEISKKKRAKRIYLETSKNIIQLYNYFLTKGIKKDEVSKILQYGIYGTGIINLPIESIIGLKREYLLEKEWMPDEVGLLIRKIERETRKLGIDLLYTTREASPRNIYPYPNIFKNPAKTNIVRELRKKEKLPEGTKLLSVDAKISVGLKNKLDQLWQRTERMRRSLKQIKKNWMDILILRQEIFRDYNLALSFKFLSSIPWRVWGEKKRHRTCPQVIESIYYCINRAAQKFSKFRKQIKRQKVDKKVIEEIEEVFSIPKPIKENAEFLSKYLLVASEAFNNYRNLIRLKIKPKDAIFLIPRAVKIDILQEYDLYNLLTGYYPLRLCSTAEEEMFKITWKEASQIRKTFKQRGLDFLNKFIGPKCHSMGFCPEYKSCGLILPAVKKYNEKFHLEMQEELRKLLDKKLKNLGSV
jgi:thymidylate synthase ThyX